MLNYRSLRRSLGILLNNRNSLCDLHNWHDGILHHVAELREAYGAEPPADALHRGTGCCRDLWVLPPHPAQPLPSPCLPEKGQSVAEGRLTDRRLKGQDQALLPSPALSLPSATSSFPSSQHCSGLVRDPSPTVPLVTFACPQPHLTGSVRLS